MSSGYEVLTCHCRTCKDAGPKVELGIGIAISNATGQPGSAYA